MARKGSRDSQHSDTGSEPDDTRFQLVCNYIIIGFKRFITFLFSHVGLASVIVGYSFLGGIMFKAIELPNEKEVRKLALKTVNRFKDKIVDFTESENEVALYRSLWNKELPTILKDFEDAIVMLTKDHDWDGQLGDEPYQWTFANSLLYSVTIITTIGYGNVTPKTQGGRLLSIVYAIFGIPLTMLCLRNFGDLLARIFRKGYRLTCTNMTYQYIKLKRRRIKNKFIKRLQKKTTNIRHWASSKQSLVSSIIHRQMSHRSQDSGDHADKHQHIDSNVPTIEDLSSDEDDIVELYQTDDNERREVRRQRSRSFQYQRRDSLDKHDFHVHRKLSMGASKPMDHTFERVLSTVNDLSIIPEDSTDFDIRRPISPRSEISLDKSSTTSELSLHDFEQDDIRLKERLKSTRDFVPISVCLLLVTGYIIGGAILFTSWETGWDFLIGFYFCFITLSTIGFGDFVPGMVNQNWDSDGRRWICIAYLVVGMALLAMSFHLIQEEVRHKFRKMAIKIGLIEEKLTQMLDKYDK